MALFINYILLLREARSPFLGRVFGILSMCLSVCPSITAKRLDQLIVMIVYMTFFIPRLSDKCISLRFFTIFIVNPLQIKRRPQHFSQCKLFSKISSVKNGPRIFIRLFFKYNLLYNLIILIDFGFI